jgi:protein-L-isoaspartate(D-aspartate) O-methyltransferase
VCRQEIEAGVDREDGTEMSLERLFFVILRLPARQIKGKVALAAVRVVGPLGTARRRAGPIEYRHRPRGVRLTCGRKGSKINAVEHEVFVMMRRRSACLSAVVFSLILFSSCASAGERDTYGDARKEMVETQLIERGIADARVLSAMRSVPRHLFVPTNLVDRAYGDYPLPIGYGQTISQPYIVALMTELAAIGPTARVLEIGTGSGYQAAVLSLLCAEVYTIEIKKELAEGAEGRLAALGYRNVKVRAGDGYFGWPEAAPFDAVIITCAANHIPPPLLSQLKDGGRLVLPLGSTLYVQTLTLVTKTGGDFEVKHLIPVTFVPMTGEMEKGR